MLGIGEELKKIREEKGLSIYDIERETKIKATFINAIEEENFDKMPGRVYVKGFIKNYAKFLGLDYTGYLQEINKLFQEDKEEDILANSKPQLVRPIKNDNLFLKILKIALLLIVISAIAFGGFKGFNYFMSPKDETPPVSEESEAQTDPDEPGTELEQQPEPEVEQPGEAPIPVETENENNLTAEEASAEKIELEVIMSEGGPGMDSCWIQVIIDGKLEFEETILAGRAPMTFTAEKSIDFTYGNAAALKIKVNGENQGVLGETGEVGTKRFRIEDL